MMSVMVGDKGEEWTYIKVVYTLNTDRSEDLLNPIFSPFHLLTIDRD
jgi:hypothetical protein